MTNPEPLALALDALRVCLILAAAVVAVFGAAAVLAWALDLDGYRSADRKASTRRADR